MGLDSRSLSPELVRQVVALGVIAQPYQEAARALQVTGGPAVSAKTIERVACEVGQELEETRNCPPSRMSRTLVPLPPTQRGGSGGGQR